MNEAAKIKLPMVILAGTFKYLNGLFPWAVLQVPLGPSVSVSGHSSLILGSYYKSCLISSGTPPYPTLGGGAHLRVPPRGPLRYFKARNLKYLYLMPIKEV